MRGRPAQFGVASAGVDAMGAVGKDFLGERGVFRHPGVVFGLDLRGETMGCCAHRREVYQSGMQDARRK